MYCVPALRGTTADKLLNTPFVAMFCCWLNSILLAVKARQLNLPVVNMRAG